MHGQESSYIPLLYDFEELEGDLNFLTRVVVLTFYPSVPGRTPPTLGEIEVLGVSLPWIDIFSKNGTGLQFIEHLQERANTDGTQFHGSDLNNSTNPFLCDSYPNIDISSSSSNGIVVESDPPNALTNSIDLLTGDLVFLQSTSPLEVSSSLESAGSRSEVLTDFFDSFVAGDTFSAASAHPQELNHKENSAAQKYLNLFKSLFGSRKGRKFDFVLAMKLEIERLLLNLSAAERDRALLSIGTDPATIDPNCLLDESYMVRLCNYANNLALLGQSSFEDQINASIGLERMDTSVIDFWNISKMGETCSGAMCEIRVEIEPIAKSFFSTSSGSSPILLVCSRCERKVCKVCCAGKGAALLASNNNYKEMKSYNSMSSHSGSNHGGQSEGTCSNQSALVDGVICKLCCSEVILYAIYVDYVRVLSSLRRRFRADSAAGKALGHVIGHEVNKISKYSQDAEIHRKQLKKLLNGEESLAEFPNASILHKVETAVGSEPFLSLLTPLCIGDQHSYWRAPPHVSTIEISIVLGTLSDVSGVALIVSSCGYSTSDCPIVQIYASNKIPREERSCMGKWDVASQISSSPQLYGKSKSCSGDDIPRHVKFLFNNPVRCRIIWITLTLPQLGSSSLTLDEKYNLLSLDESSFPKSSHDASFDGTQKTDPCIHAKRIIVFGNSLRKEMGQDASLQVAEMMKVKNLLERSPRPNRFRVPIEAERLTDNDLILEQYLSPTVPGLAGFRLDAFNVIIPRITHSPSPLDSKIWESSLTCLEDRHITPAVLYIQVSAVQESRNLVTVGDYRLPIVRAGTALYFDFPRPIQARRVTFKLLGDVAAFADDIAEQDDSISRTLPLASGLSLSNRIKLYYYADPYELGKLASLSAV